MSKLTKEEFKRIRLGIQQTKIDMIATDQLLPYAKNPMKHPEWQIAQLASSIREFGFTNPVLVDENGEIIAGHGRVMAALKLDLPEVPCITLKNLTAAQRRAYVIVDNQLARNSHWDDDLLREEIIDIRDSSEVDLSLLGFQEQFIDDLILGGPIGDGGEGGGGSGGGHPEDDPEVEWSPEIEPGNNYMVVLFDNKEDFQKVAERFDLTRVKANISPSAHPAFLMYGRARFIPADRFLEELGEKSDA